MQPISRESSEDEFEPIAEHHSVDLDGSLAAGHDAPVAVDTGEHRALNLVASLDSDDDRRIGKRYATDHQLGPVAGGVYHGLKVALHEELRQRQRPGRGRRLGDLDNIGAEGLQLRGKGERQRPRSRHQDASPRQDALDCDHRLRGAGGDDARQGPAGNGHRPVAGARRDDDCAGFDRTRGNVVAHKGDALVPDAPDNSAGADVGAASHHFINERLAGPKLVASGMLVGNREAGTEATIDLSTERNALVEDADQLDPGPARFNGGGHPGRSATDNDEVLFFD